MESIANIKRDLKTQNIKELIINGRKEIIISIICSIFFAYIQLLNNADQYNASVTIAPTSNNWNYNYDSRYILTHRDSPHYIGERGFNSYITFGNITQLSQTRDFLNYFINKRIKPEDLIAVSSWDSANNQLIYDPKIFNSLENNWIINKPTEDQLYRAFKGRFKVYRRFKSQFIELAIFHESPQLAEEWLAHIAGDLNTFYINKIDRQISYAEMNLANLSEINKNIYLNKELASKMVNNFVYKFENLSPSGELFIILDSIVISDNRFFNYFKFYILSIIIGSGFGLFIASLRYLYN
tara:strand:+ start:4157 stop:5047 length:891 start_codon:yes stop_codon:yes gene_type:complete